MTAFIEAGTKRPRLRINLVRIKHYGAVSGVSGIFIQGSFGESSATGTAQETQSEALDGTGPMPAIGD